MQKTTVQFFPVDEEGKYTLKIPLLHHSPSHESLGLSPCAEYAHALFKCLARAIAPSVAVNHNSFQFKEIHDLFSIICFPPS